jgi:hypothetical protein
VPDPARAHPDLAQVEMLLTWASAGGCELRAAAPGPHGLTPLHLAALLDDGGALAALLTGAPGPCLHPWKCMQRQHCGVHLGSLFLRAPCNGGCWQRPACMPSCAACDRMHGSCAGFSPLLTMLLQPQQDSMQAA